jgi:succinyl-diaminopimelate desuccinylase
MNRRNDIIDYVNKKSNIDEFCDFLSELIQQESYDGTEENVANVIRKHFEKEGIYTEEKAFAKRPNIIAFYNDSEKNFNATKDKILVYNGHMDTVPPGNWKDAFSGKRDEEYIHGRGSTDMKSGLTAMIFALTILKRLNVKLKGNLILNAVSDEEKSGMGTLKAIKQMRKGEKFNIEKCSFVVVGEPSSFIEQAKTIIIGEKGSVNYKIKTVGERGHSSLPFKGINPIYKMTKLIDEDFLKTIVDKINEEKKQEEAPIKKQELIENLKDYNLSNEEIERMEGLYEFIPELTFACTILKAGSVPNVIPEDCEASINFRIPPGYDIDEIYEILKDQIEQKAKELEIKPSPLVEPNIGASASMFKGYKNSDELLKFKEIIAEVYGEKPFYFFFPATTDARLYRTEIKPPFCPKTIVFGPGYIKEAHQINEKVRIDDFINAIKVYTLFAYDYLQGEFPTN